MALEVIGAGFGRTGTKSLKFALEQLGLGPCHHMYEVLQQPRLLPYWQEAVAGRMSDWEALFSGFRSTVDWPSTLYWRELAEAYPEAKVVLTLRPEEAWIESVHNTIFPLIRDFEKLEGGHVREVMRMAHAVILDETFGGRLGDRQHAIEVYRAHNAEVQRAIAPERLLVLEVGEGWERLCAFLGLPVPGEPYPSTNSTAEFRERRRRGRDLS